MMQTNLSKSMLIKSLMVKLHLSSSLREVLFQEYQGKMKKRIPNPMKMIKAEKESNKKMTKSEISIDLYLCEIWKFDENLLMES